MFTTSEYKGNPVVTVGQTGGRSFTFGKAKIGAILANLAEVQQWYNEQTNAETFAVITCHECGAEWAWASDMPDKPYKPETPTETLCNACKDANRELVGRYPLAGVELIDLNSVLQLPAGEPKTAKPAKAARKDNTWDARYPILLNASKDATPEQKGTPVDPFYIVGANMYGLTVEEYKNGYVRCEICNAKILGDDTFNTCPKCREPEEKPRKKSGLSLAKGTMGPIAPKRKGQMFSDRETLGPKHQGNAALIEHGQPLELKVQDPRTDEEREADQRKAEEAQNYTLPGMGDSNTGEESRTPPLPHQLKLYTKANRQFAEAYWTWINSDGSEPAPSQPDNVKRYDFQRIRDICDKAERKLIEASKADSPN